MDLLLKLFNVSISASWLVLAVVLFRLVFRKAPKAITVFLWALVAVRLICPVSLESSLSLIPNAETIPTEILAVDPHKGVGSTTFEVIENPVYTDFIDSEVTVDSIDSFQWDVVYLTYGWIFGMGIMVLYSIISYLRIYLKIRQSVPLRENIFICDDINTPFIFGVVRPRIYLPSSMNEEDMSYVIAHEKAHLKRKDYLWKPLGFLLLTVYWFNPVLWLAYVLLCRDIELACDEKVIKEMGTDIKKPYSMALINCSVPRRMISACPVAFGEVGVKKRIKAVLNYKKPAFWVIAAAVIASIAVAVCFMTNPVSEKTEVEKEFLWYYNPTYSAVGYGILAFYPDDGYEIVSAEATEGEAFIKDKYYNSPDNEKYAGWSPDYTDLDSVKEADITIKAVKDEEEKIFTVRVTRTVQEDENGTGTYFAVSGVNCAIEEYGWAVYKLSDSDNVFSSDLDQAVAKAILSSNAIKDWRGECAAEGHVILGTDKEGDKIKVYLLEQYSVFGFQNGWFLEQSGYSTSAVMTFEETETGYKYLGAEHPRDGSLLGDDIKAMFPKKYQKRALSATDKERESMWAQKVAYAEAYLKEIGREAKIGTYGDIEHILLTDVGVSVEVSNTVINLPLDYNTGEIGYFERLENGTRYIYRTSYLADKNIILYTKEGYGTNKIVERVEVDSLTGNIISTGSSSVYFDAKVLDVEKNGDFVLVEPFENTGERKTADRIWVSLNVSSEVPVPDVYEGLYIRIMYDGMIEESYPAKIPNVSAIYLYADVNYIGNEAAPSENKEPTTEAHYAEETTTPLISVGDSENYYYIYQSYTGDVSTLTLSPTGKRFSFTLSIYSSYLPMGTYEEDDKYVILKTDDGKNTYTFEKSKGDLIFSAEKSSSVPEYKYSGAYTKAVPCIPANAVFGFADVLEAYYDKIVADIDNDGIAEECTLGFGPTSGLLTFTFSAYENGMEEYANTFLEMGSTEVYWEFEKGADGKVRVISKDDEYGSVIRKYDIKIKNGDIELVSDDKVISRFASKPESEEFKGLKSDFEALKNYAFSYYTENKAADGDETTLQIVNGKLKKLDDLKATTVEIPDLLEKSVAAVDNVGYDWIDVTENYVAFWSDELRTYGILFSEKPTKAIRAIKEDGYTGMDSNKIEKYWYEVGQLYG